MPYTVSLEVMGGLRFQPVGDLQGIQELSLCFLHDAQHGVKVFQDPARK